ncbi:RNA polymerase subunit sigma [Paenibacillus sp. NPDC056579]|uniref:RNA polymerase subunit sigma n=1 Tax=Paenibacillus sp. NPDC056579 TaxID=3345871 RepID=UPI0036D0B022
MRKMKLDISSKRRRFTPNAYCLDAKGIARLLRDGHHIRSRTYYAGDYAGVDILTDLTIAMESASLTTRQAESIHWVYIHDVTLDTAGMRMGITKQAVQDAVATATRKIAAVFKQWHDVETDAKGQKEGEPIGS